MVDYKWHRLRRRRGDPAFTRARLEEGAALGAVLEVDLRLCADGFVVLHDADLSGETTGQGPVRAARLAEIAALTLRDSGAAPLTLRDLGEAARAMPSGHLQLDFKDPVTTLPREHRAAFAAAFAGAGPRVVLSGANPEVLRALAATVAGMRMGYDPCDDDTLAAFTTPERIRAFAAEAIARAPDAAMIYLAYPLILRARALGVPLVGLFRDAGLRVDAYTLNPDTPDAPTLRNALIAEGVTQITTDAPEELAEG